MVIAVRGALSRFGHADHVGTLALGIPPFILASRTEVVDRLQGNASRSGSLCKNLLTPVRYLGK